MKDSIKKAVDQLFCTGDKQWFDEMCIEEGLSYAEYLEAMEYFNIICIEYDHMCGEMMQRDAEMEYSWTMEDDKMDYYMDAESILDNLKAKERESYEEDMYSYLCGYYDRDINPVGPYSWEVSESDQGTMEVFSDSMLTLLEEIELLKDQIKRLEERIGYCNLEPLCYES